MGCENYKRERITVLYSDFLMKGSVEVSNLESYWFALDPYREEFYRLDLATDVGRQQAERILFKLRELRRKRRELALDIDREIKVMLAEMANPGDNGLEAALAEVDDLLWPELEIERSVPELEMERLRDVRHFPTHAAEHAWADDFVRKYGYPPGKLGGVFG